MTRPHRCESCQDQGCHLPYCRVWKEARKEGYDAGYQEGFADGFAAGSAAQEAAA